MNITPYIQKYFKEQKVEITLYPSKIVKKFKSIEIFIKFFEDECKYWRECNSGNLYQVRQHFQSIYNYLNRSANSDDESIESLKSAIKNAKVNRGPCIYSQSVEAKLLKKLYDNNQDQADAAFGYMFNKSMVLNNDYNQFLGIMYAYNLQDRDKLSEKTVEAEKQALTDLRDTSSAELQNLSSEFFSQVEEIKAEHASIYEKLKEDQEKLRQDHEQFSIDTQSLLDRSEKRVNDLEDLYKEKLRLEAPAKYWQDLNIEYKKSGKSWRDWAVGSGVVFIIFLTIILYKFPATLFENFGFNSVKATIIFALIASIGVYIIRFFVMLSTSSYHLARDAHERYQLTYIYLSLLKENAIDTTERSIVLQALFSRADTGLLKGDSSPAFPGVLEQIIKNVKKQ